MTAPPSTDQARDELRRFERLLDDAESASGPALSFDALRSLARLYRRHATALARLRQHDDDPEAIRHLNALCVRAYTLLYSQPPARGARHAWMRELPRWWAQAWPALLLAWLLLGIGMLIGGAAAWRDTDALASFVPTQLGYSGQSLERLATSAEARQDFLTHEAMPIVQRAFFGSFLFIHNTRIGLLSLATGMLAGVPTVLLQLYNGVTLGAFASIFLHDPWPILFLAWILPHGIPELTAISLCAAAGLLLGQAVASPGRRGQRAALRSVINPVLLLCATALPLFAIAALIEGFVRESGLSTATRLGVAATMLALLAAALYSTRRMAQRYEVDTSWLRDITSPARSESPDSGSAPPPSWLPEADRASAARRAAASPTSSRAR
jgi:uncharacterized membrane protein SpoIIM required for sporulation